MVWLRHLRWSDRRVGKGDDGRGDPGGGAGVAGVWTARLAAISERSGAGYVRMAAAATFATNPAERFAHGPQAFLDSMRRQLHEPAATTTPPRRRASLHVYHGQPRGFEDVAGDECEWELLFSLQ